MRRFEPIDRTAIQEGLDRQVAAWKRRDLVSFMEGYAHSSALVFTSGGDIRRGWQDTFERYKTYFATDPGTLELKIDSIDPVGADGAVVLGHFELTGTEHAGRGVCTLVVERRPEGWRIIHDHTTSTTTPPPSADALDRGGAGRHA